MPPVLRHNRVESEKPLYELLFLCNVLISFAIYMEFPAGATADGPGGSRSILGLLEKGLCELPNSWPNLRIHFAGNMIRGSGRSFVSGLIRGGGHSAAADLSRSPSRFVKLLLLPLAKSTRCFVLFIANGSCDLHG